MAPSGGISGLAVTISAGGLLLIYSGIKDVPIIQGLREVAAGKIPTPTPPRVSALTFLPGAAGGSGGVPPGGSGGAGSWGVPVAGRVTDRFGSRFGFHKGVDIAAKQGTPVRATRPGTVVVAQANFGSAGNYVKIDHGAGMASAYMHLSRILVKKGMVLTSAEVIGEVGSTGDSTGPHLHFEIHQNGKKVNPENYVRL